MSGRVWISTTRLVVPLRAIPGFLRRVEAVRAELRHVDGFLGGALLVEPRRAFWTLTAWDGPRAMRAFRDGGAHATVMPLLAEMGSEAAYGGWWQDDATLPPWAEVHRRLVANPTFTPLSRPHRRHREEHIPAPRLGLPRPLPPMATASASETGPGGTSCAPAEAGH